MIKIFEINNKKYIYQNVGEELLIKFKNCKETKTMLTNSILHFNELANFEIETIQSTQYKTRILGFKNCITNDLISIEHYHEKFPNEIIETNKYDFINPSFQLNLFHKDHKLERENFYENFEINENLKFTCDSNFQIKPFIIDDDSLVFKGNIIKHKIFNNYRIQDVYSYNFDIVCFGLNIQKETLDLVKNKIEQLDQITHSFAVLKELIA